MVIEINEHRWLTQPKLQYQGLIFNQFANLQFIESFCFTFFLPRPGNVLEM